MESNKHLDRRLDIQGLRALAVLLVILAHAKAPGFSGGFIGVDVFFVLSGFLITGLLLKEYQDRDEINYVKFVARRFRRLFPALITMLALTMLVAPGVLSSYEFSQQTASAPYAATWVSNLFFLFSDKDYFAELQTRDLFLHTWSLGVEEQFYILWPALLLGAGWYIGRFAQKNLRRTYLNLFAFLTATGLVLSIVLSNTYPLHSFYLMPSRIWQFALGAMVSIYVEFRMNPERDVVARKASAKAGYIAGAGLLMIVGAAVLLDENVTYPGFWAMIPSLGAALVIYAGCFGPYRGPGALLSSSPAVWIGDRSYSWYLWHWPVLILGFGWVVEPTPLIVVALVLLSLMIAMTSYNLVEYPFWKGRLSSASPVQAIVVTLAVMAVSVVALPKLHQFTGIGAGEAVKKKLMHARFDAPVIYALGCDSWYHSAELRPCIAAKKKHAKTAVLFGDSIGAQWYTLLPEIYRAPEWRIVVLTKSSCPIVDEDFFYARIGKVFRICTAWRNKALKYLEKVKPDVIVIGSDATYGFTKRQWVEGSRRIISRLSPAAGKIMILPATHELGADGPGCLEKKDSDSCAFRLPPNSHRNNVAGYLDTVAKGFRNVWMLNLNHIVCPNDICRAQTADGLIVYRDGKHLTNSFVHAKVPEVLMLMKKTGIGVPAQRPSQP